MVPSVFAAAYDTDPATGDVLVVLMSEATSVGPRKVWKPNWDSVYMLPQWLVKQCRLEGMLNLSWTDGWAHSVNSDKLKQLAVRADKAVQSWLAQEGLKQLRAKVERVAAAHKAGLARLKQLYEGQVVVMASGTVAEVRGLERSSDTEVSVLPYDLVEILTPNQSVWRLQHASTLQRCRRSDLQPADWTWNPMSVSITVHVA